MTPDGAAMLRAALDLTDRGMHLFPLRPTTKIPPRGVTWGTVATNDRGTITYWWGHRWQCASIGVSCGPSRIVVIDIDGPEGEQAWRQLTAEHSDVPTATVTTGRTNGGRHLWYRAPDGIEIRNTGTTAETRFAPNIDIRGVGGMVVAPPSLHKSGRRYVWADRVPMAPLPGWVADRISRIAELRKANHVRVPVVGLPSRRPPASGSRDERWARACLAESARDVAGMAEGSGRNNRLNGAAYKCGRLVAGGLLDEAAVFDALADAAAACGLPQGEALRTITSGMAAGMRSPRTSGANT